MAEIKEIVAYLMAGFPNKDALTTARVTKMVYLADWKSSIDHYCQMTSIKWYFDSFGPFVWDVETVVKNDPGTFRIEAGLTQFGSQKKVFRLINSHYQPTLRDEERAILDHVLKVTKDLDWSRFIQLVYSTYPIVASDRYTHLNLPDLANRYREEKRLNGR